MLKDGYLTPEELMKQTDFEDYYRSIFNTTTDMIALTDGDRIFDANTAFIDFFSGYGKDIFSDTFVFSSLLEVVNKFGYVYDGYQGKRWFEHVLSGNKEHYLIGVTLDAKRYAFNITLRLIEAQKKVYVATLTDVTEMMGYKSALEEGIRNSLKDSRKSEFMLHQYDKAIDAATLVYKCDLHGKITYANKALCSVLKYAQDELIGQSIAVLRGPNTDDVAHQNIWEKVSLGEIYQGVVENIDKEGGLHYFDLSVVPIVDPDGKVAEFLSIRHEITEVISAKETAIRTLESKTKFFDQISHELRTPLNAILNFTDQALESFEEMFEDEASREMVHMFIERSHKNSQHLLNLINSLLDMAKLRAGKEKYVMLPTEITAIVQDVYESTVGLNKNPALEYLLNRPRYPISIQCDVLKFRQILTNLISNAVKFTEWGFVEIRVKQVGNECWIEVQDSGIGIPAEKIGSIFEPFEQVHAHDQGTGLGLGIVNEYSKAMGMTLSVESVPGEGSCFTLKAPTIKTEAEEDTWSI